MAVVAYLPILNNGFIADDYVILKRIETLKAQPFYLYHVPPENFRLVSYLIFGTLKTLVGYEAWAFYAFNIALHMANLILLSRLLRTLISDEMATALAVLLFAIFQAPQEAVMWLAAMNETTLFFFTVLALICWSQKRYALATLAYTVALFSKESGIIVLALILLFDAYREKRIFWKRYLLLLIPTAGMATIFLFTASNNFMLRSGSYAFSPHALLVLVVSLHRLLWPWFYIIVFLIWVTTGRLPRIPALAAWVGAVIVTMLPYMFIAYQSSLPSRQLYLGSAVLMTMFAVLLKPLRGKLVLKALIVVFVTFNIGYLWFRKDGQFEERAAPTTQLVNVLKEHRPQRTTIKNFAYPYPDIPKAATLAVPGWDPSLVSFEDGSNPCADCLQLQWDARIRKYLLSPPRAF